MSDLIVRFDRLRESRSALNRLHDEFHRATERVHDSDGIWGHHAVADAMDDFAGNWKIHREKLLGNMQKVQDMTEACIDAFQQAEGHLAAAIEVHR